MCNTTNGETSSDTVFYYKQNKYQLRSGICTSTPEILADGRIRLYEQRQWTVDEHSEGESILEEVRA